MADLTQSAVDTLLGLLTRAIQDEAQLMGGVPGNMKFIKDEMDSMNGFLLHLTKRESEHDDQIRAWMKQVREITYMAEDCVERYLQDVYPYSGDGRFLATLGLLVRHPKKYILKHSLAKQILELKVRVNEVGERRRRYDVKVPREVSDLTLAEKPEDYSAAQEEKREAFRRALEEDADGIPILRRAVGLVLPAAAPLPPFISRAIGKLPHYYARSEAATVARGILKKCSPDDETTRFICKMLLRALHEYPYERDNLELKKLKKKLAEEGAEEIKKQVMVFCYSLLSTHQKSCLQYLTAFLQETAISRTSLVRRWVAEGLVGKEQGTRTPEEIGECYFNELLFRGFIHPARIGDAGTVKSCKLDGLISDFITSIAKSENFVGDLPTHLKNHNKIRRIVGRSWQQQQQSKPRWDCWWNICRYLLCRSGMAPPNAAGDELDESKYPMDALVDFLKKLPEMYRLNVLDLGGCRGLKPYHLKSICTMACLKYLSLRNTDVSRLEPRHLRCLTLLETLDIRQTKIPPCNVKKIYLPKLKHLLAGSKNDAYAVEVPAKIGQMRQMETLCHVQVSNHGTELQGVAKLRKLRKLGVVVHGNDHTTAGLVGVVNALAGCLRLLSVRVTQGGGVLDISILQDATSSLTLENLDIRGRISLPTWIAKAPKLANVTLRETELSGGDALRRLASVLTLRCLKLGRDAFAEQALIFKDLQFNALKFLVLEGDTITRITFKADDAAPMLEKIAWTIGRLHNDGDLIVGIDNLRNLKLIELRGNFNLTKLLEWKEANATNPAAPRYRCRYVNSSDDKEITAIPKADTDTTLSLPPGAVIDQQAV